jgi:O-antigen/teichoic acid export membrane protein
MSSLKKLARHSSHYFGGRAAELLLGFVSFPIFTRVFTLEQYGLMALVSHIVLIFTTFAKVGMQHPLQRFFREHQDAEGTSIRHYYSTLFNGVAIISVLVLGVYSGALAISPRNLLSVDLRDTLLIAGLLISIRAARSMVDNLLQVEQQTAFFNFLSVGTKAATLILICCLLFFWEKTVRAFFLGTIIVEGAALLGMLPYLIYRQILSFSVLDIGLLREMLRFGAPMTGAELGAVLLDSGDRVLIQIFLGSAALGTYAAVYAIANYVAELLVYPVRLALFPICMEIWSKEGRQETEKFLGQSMKYFLLVTVGVLAVVTVTARDVVVFLASRKYEAGSPLLPWLFIGLTFATFQVFFRAGLLLSKRSDSIAWAFAASVAVNLSLNVLLLPKIGIVAGAIATFAGSVVLVLFTANRATRLVSVPLHPKDTVLYLFCGSCATAVALLITHPVTILEMLMRASGSLFLYAVLLWLLSPDVRAHTQRVLSRLGSGKSERCLP